MAAGRVDTCAVCGDAVPEGRQICWACENWPRFPRKVQAERYARAMGWNNYAIMENGMYYTAEDKTMTPNEYQRLAMKTKNSKLTTPLEILADGAIGLCGETGEVADMIKKALFQGHSLDLNKLAEELGDSLWYIAYIADFIGCSLEDIMEGNIKKLGKRYPGGFSEDRSVNRAVYPERTESGLTEDGE